MLCCGNAARTRHVGSLCLTTHQYEDCADLACGRSACNGGFSVRNFRKLWNSNMLRLRHLSSFLGGHCERKTKTCFEFGVGPDYLFEMLQEFQVEILKGEHAQVGQVR